MWYILCCPRHGVHFGENPVKGATRHLQSSQHGNLKVKIRQAVEHLGIKVHNCNSALAELNNSAFIQAQRNGYKPLNSNRLPKTTQILISQSYNSEKFRSDVDAQDMSPIERAKYRLMQYQPPHNLASLKQTQRQLRETERQLKETQRQLRETQRQARSVTKHCKFGQSGHLGRKHTGLAWPDLVFSDRKTESLPPLRDLCEKDQALSSAIQSVDSRHLHHKSTRKVVSRTKTGCFTCRKRGKKCDESKPHCKLLKFLGPRVCLV